MRPLLAVALLAWAGPAGAAGLPAETQRAAVKLRDAARASQNAAEVVRTLTDHIGPRLSGSPGGRAAEAWALATLKSLGLEAVHAEAVMVPRWERGVETAQMTAPYRQVFAVTALGGSPPTPPSGLERPVVETENGESLATLLKADPHAVKDKIVFFNAVMKRTRNGSGYAKAVTIRWTGPAEAARAGAAAVVIRTVGTSSDRLPHTGAMKTEGEAALIPAAALSAPDADVLDRVIREGQPATLRLVLTCRTLPDVDGANIVGEVRGAEKPEEIVLLGAHLDSWDLGTGAVDDGAGVAVVAEAARLIASGPRRPRRTIRVVLFANEENGGRGSKGYIQAHEAEMPRHVAALEMDLGTDPVVGLSALTGPEGHGAVAGLRELLKPLGATEPSPEGEAGADVSALRSFGVPLFGLRQDASRYFDIHHSANDTFDKINPDSLGQVAAATVVLAYGLADAPGGFGRVPESKRRLPEW